jgi:hypothetical protein
MSAAQSRQKSYVDNRRQPLEFKVGDRIFLKISPMKGVMRFGKKGKLSPQFIGPFEITQRVGRLAYKVANPDVIVEYEPLGIYEGLTYVEEPVRIVGRKEQVLRTKTILIVKVLWLNHGVEEVSWEAKHDMRSHYPHLFE